MTRSIQVRLFATTILAAMAPIAPAAAQQTPVDTAENTPAEVEAAQDPTPEPTDPQDDIVVTGTRIARPDLVASSPVAVISDESIKQANTVTVEQVLNANPQFVSSFTGSSNNPGTGAATVDLRGLGIQRTLVLIDGKRGTPYDPTGVVDVNAIPTSLIKRVEVLTGGASAVYGSDAISGVVNFVMNDRFEGIQFDGSSQISKYGDAGFYDVSLTGGMKIGDRGNIVVSGGYSQRNPVYFDARSYTRETLDSFDPTQSGGSGNTVPTVFDLPNASLQVTPGGGLSEDILLYSYNPVNYAQLPFKRWNAMGLFRYDISDGVEAYARANYAHIKVSTNLAATATAGFAFNIDPSNPFLSPAMQSAFFDTTLNPELQINDGLGVGDDPTARAGTSVIGIRRRIVETGGRLTETTNNNQQYVGGLRGDLGAFNWDIFAQWGKTAREQILNNDLSYTALQQALDVVAGPGGTPACFNPAGGCVPLNVFTTDPLPQDALAFVLRNAQSNDKVTQFVTGANIGGDLNFLQSPLASSPAAASVGVEYRKEKASTVVDDNYASGDLIYYGQGQNVSGRYDVKEIFGEFKLPLVQDRPGIHSLGIEAGARYSDYSTVGGVSTYKLGGDYAPVEGVRFRSIYQRAVRAPSIYELYSPLVAATGGLTSDPCAGADVPAAIAAVCIAQGAPAVGNIPQPIAGQINIFYGGNPDLSEETSDTFTAGVVLNPRSIRGFSASIDYYKIKIADAIAATPPSVIIQQCYSNPSMSNPFCQGIVRSSGNGSLSGNIDVGVPAGLGNVGAISTEGVDFAAAYSGGDRQAFNYAVIFNGNWLRSYKFKPDADTPANQCAGTFGPLCQYEPLPKWRHVMDVTLGWAPVRFTTRWRYLGGTHADSLINGPDGIANQHIKAYSYIDETISFDISEKYTLRLGILNLFDKKPPFVGDTSGASLVAGGTYPNTYDVIGRSFFANVTARF